MVVGVKTTLLYGVIGGALASAVVGPLAYFAGYSYASFKQADKVAICQGSLNEHMAAETQRLGKMSEDLETEKTDFIKVMKDVQYQVRQSAKAEADTKRKIGEFEDELSKINIPNCGAPVGDSLRKLYATD